MREVHDALADFELTCLAPRELDLACNETSARDRGRSAQAADKPAYLDLARARLGWALGGLRT
jgi:hypothetical protein